MSEHPPLMQQLAVRPIILKFTLDELVVRCPKCQKERTYKLHLSRPGRDSSCPSCGHPWRFNG